VDLLKAEDSVVEDAGDDTAAFGTEIYGKVNFAG
jgi:hypothetical protein